ncbi:MAG: hypothetical protein ACI9KN_000335 [Gammaproteobacteria bacterium]|jgi:hypothetical protein
MHACEQALVAHLKIVTQTIPGSLYDDIVSIIKQYTVRLTIMLMHDSPTLRVRGFQETIDQA